ncbi:class E sortase [Streptomyces sp. SAJ15]|uniref:class E sortase n=1 Tax=Streptomyces sp. SAJ15 TaxID=2011095 RepID=UPI0011862DEA|nr:class E sortase [Streptomyces sp. SAJ15]TVL89206.1 class E sortase [Streptomyces sp. SAJ15]
MRQRAPAVLVRGPRARRRAALARALWGGAEAALTLGVVLSLLVVHQLWWTNRQAREGARREVAALERRWDAAEPGASSGGGSATGPRAGPEGGADGGGTSRAEGGTERPRGAGRSAAPAPGRAYAVLRIPRLGLAVPIAEGVGRRGVLNKGYAGHYPRSAPPGGVGNFALAGHRNAHGEPFRHLDRLRPGDTVRVDTAEARYTYAVERTLPRTSPGDGTVLAAVPYSSTHPGHRFTRPGHYLTLTTCTPAFSSRYRLVVWGTLRAAAPR